MSTQLATSAPARTLARIAAVHRSQLGVRELPAGSNKVRYNTWYYGREVSGPKYSWCDVGQSWAFDQIDALDLIGGKHAYTPDHAQWFRDHGQWSATPVLGALNFMWHADLSRIAHVGWVEAIAADGHSWWDNIEYNTDVAGGRTGGQVMRQRRTTSGGHDSGFGVVHYDTSADVVDLGAISLAAATIPAQGGSTRAPMRLPVVQAGHDAGGWDFLAQRALAEAGLYRGPIDGVLSPGGASDRAIRDLQARAGETVDGVIGGNTWAALMATHGTLRQGARGYVAIEVLQNALGYRGADLDRVFGPATAARVQEVQRWGGLTGPAVDGIVGPATRALFARA